MVKVTPVILSGGTGTRLWPLSRQSYPKQLLALTGERTLLQEAALRGTDAVRFGVERGERRELDFDAAAAGRPAMRQQV